MYPQNIPQKSLPQPDDLRGFDDLRRTSALEVGTGGRAFKADESGIWLGGNKFTDAPFSVDMEGALAAKSATFTDGDDTTIIDAQGLVALQILQMVWVHTLALATFY